MRAVLTSPLLYVGLLIGIVGARHFGGPASAPIAAPRIETKTEDPPPELNWLNEKQIREYYALKSMEERYRLADELLGKVMMALIAARFVDFSDVTSAKVKESAEGRADSVTLPSMPPLAIGAALPSAPAPQAVAALPLPKPHTDSSARREPNPSGEMEVAGVTTEAGQTTSFPFTAEVHFKTTPCLGENTWFVNQAHRAFYTVEPDTDSEVHDLVGVLTSKSLTKSDITLMHCLPLSFKKWRATVIFKVRAENLRGSRFRARVWDEQGKEVFLARNARLDGTYGWRDYEIPLTVPLESAAIGFTMSGTGKLWIKGVKILRVRSFN